MRRWYEIWIGRHYVRARSRNGFVSFISAISMLGIAIAVAVLIIVLSVVNGFERELKDKILAMTAHATIESTDGKLNKWQARSSQAIADPAVVAVAPFVDGQALLTHSQFLSGVELRGIDPQLENDVSGIAALLQSGDLDSLTPGGYNIVLGADLAAALGVSVGDKLTATLAEGVVTPAGLMPRMRRFVVTGVFRAGMYEFDRRLAFVHLRDAQRLFRMGDNVSGIRLAVSDIFLAPDIVREVALNAGGGVLVSDWTRRHVNFFRSIKITKSILFVILLMVVAVAAFNIVSTLVMVVKDKQSDIAILRTIGAKPASILGIFIFQGTIIGVLGTLAGLLLGVSVALNLEAIVGFLEQMFGIKFLAADVYFISDLPAELRWSDVGKICGIALVLALVSTIYPAWQGARTQPAEALRYD